MLLTQGENGLVEIIKFVDRELGAEGLEPVDLKVVDCSITTEETDEEITIGDTTYDRHDAVVLGNSMDNSDSAKELGSVSF